MSRNPTLTRNEILDSAWTLIRDHGAETSLSEIAKAAKTSRQTIYDHFGSRGGMLMALVQRVDERYEIKSKLYAAFAIDDPQKRLDQTICVWLDFVLEIQPVATDLIRLRTTDMDAAAAWEDRMSDLRQWLLDLTKSLKADSALSPSWTPKTASEYLWGSFSVQAWNLYTQDCNWTAGQTRKMMRSTLISALIAS